MNEEVKVVTRRYIGGYGKRSRRYPHMIVTLHRPTCRTISHLVNPERVNADFEPQSKLLSTTSNWGSTVRNCKVCRPQQSE